MSTISTIGAGKNYTTIQAWHDAFATGGWIGECYNTAEYTGQVDMTGKATSAANYLTLRTAAGESFKDNANVQTNPLRYDQSKGVGVNTNVAYTCGFFVEESYTTIQNIQFKGGGGNSGYSKCFTTKNYLSNIQIDNCLFESAGSVSAHGSWIISISNVTIRNSIINKRSGSTGTKGLNLGTSKAYGVTVVQASNDADTVTGITTSGTCTLENCAVFGFSTVSSLSGGTTSTTCMTDGTSPGAGWTGGKTYGNQFQNTSDATRDFRLKSGADLVDAGTTDSTNFTPSGGAGPIDIAGSTRPQGSSYDIGCWELVSSGNPRFGDFNFMGI